MKQAYKLLLSLLLLAGARAAVAQSYSYVYIQGDKITPFYVKLEGEMLPRYGKHYCVIPRLETGIINIDILFQQNIYPPQHFIIKVPENGSRSFLLTKKDTAFSLFDLQQGFYLPAGNQAEADHMPPPPGTASQPVTAQGIPERNTPEQNTATAPAQPPATAPGTPQFIEDIELDNEPNAGVPAEKAPEEDSAAAVETTQQAAETSAGSGCTQPLSAGLFATVSRKALQQPSEEARLGYLNTQADQCYSAEQAGRLAMTMQSDAARYSWLKKVYPHITDPAAFGQLQELFSDEAWKAYFLELIPQ